MPFQPPGGGGLAAFVTIVLAVIAASIAAVHVSNARLGAPTARRTAGFALGLAAWLSILGLVVASGAIDAAPMPRLLLFFLASNVAAIVVAMSPIGRRIATTLPLFALVAFQGFRLPLELVLHAWAVGGVIPETMTWTGKNFDVIAGSVAVLAIWPARSSRVAGWIANVVGLALLLNVMRVAMMSSPLPFAWGTTPPLLLAMHLPYAFIIPVCVSGALAGHVVLTRALLAPSIDAVASSGRAVASRS